MHGHRRVFEICYFVQFVVALVVCTVMSRRGYYGFTDGKDDLAWKRVSKIGVVIWGIAQIAMCIAVLS